MQLRYSLYRFASRAIVSYLLALTFFLSACSSSTTSKHTITAFNTRISDSGLKHFELRERARAGSRQAAEYPSQRDNRQQRSRTSSNPAKQYEKARKKMRGKAEELIASNQYCRTGFWIIDFDTDTRGVFLRGECNEPATDADRTHFPATIDFW